MMQFVTAIVVSLLLSMICWKLHMLTAGGAVASFGTGAFVGIVGSFEWFLLLVIFTVTGFVVTKVDFERKKKAGLQEGRIGERSYMNVIGVGLPPCAVAAFAFIFKDLDYIMLTAAYIGTMAVATADTIASEIGVRDANVWLITGFKKVKPGVDGGVSVLGTAASFVASVAISAVGWYIVFQDLSPILMAPAVAGFLGNLLDSVFGATLETRKIISKYTNNMVTALIGAVISALLYMAFL